MPDSSTGMLTFADKDGNLWTAAAILTRLHRAGSDEWRPIETAQDLELKVKDFKVVVR